MSIKAFPVYSPDSGTQTGMNLRDYIAIELMQGLLVASWPNAPDSLHYCKMAYKLADTMMEVREL